MIGQGIHWVVGGWSGGMGMPWGWLGLTLVLWAWPTVEIARASPTGKIAWASPTGEIVAPGAAGSNAGKALGSGARETWAQSDPTGLREQALRRGRELVVVEPQTSLAVPQTTGESNGFAWECVRLGESWVLTSPRSGWHAERSGALWIGRAAHAPRWKPQGDHPMRAWQVLGMALDLSGPWGDGRRLLALGAPLASPLVHGNGWDPGAVELFSARGERVRWVQTLVPPSPSPGGGFGSELLWVGDRLWVAAPFASSAGGLLQAGRLTLWEPDGEGMKLSWQRGGPRASAGQRFGEALAHQGNRLWVGAPGDRGRGAVFSLHENQPQNPVQQVLRPEGIAWLGSHFGASIAVGGDGDWLFVGAPEGPEGGAVLVWRRQASGEYRWHSTWRDEHGLGVSGFGTTIECIGGAVWVGAPRGAGAVWKFAPPFDLPSASVAWLGRTPAAGLGRCLLGHGGRVYASAPGHGIAGQGKPPAGKLFRLAETQSGLGQVDARRGLRWAGDWEGKGVLRAWGLAPGERVQVEWLGRGVSQAFRVDRHGNLWVPMPGPGQPRTPGSREGTLELRRDQGRPWRLALRSGGPG